MAKTSLIIGVLNIQKHLNNVVKVTMLKYMYILLGCFGCACIWLVGLTNSS